MIKSVDTKRPHPCVFDPQMSMIVSNMVNSDSPGRLHRKPKEPSRMTWLHLNVTVTVCVAPPLLTWNLCLVQTRELATVQPTVD